MPFWSTLPRSLTYFDASVKYKPVEHAEDDDLKCILQDILLAPPSLMSAATTQFTQQAKPFIEQHGNL